MKKSPIKKRVLSVCLFVLLCLMCAPTVPADSTYKYIGNPMTETHGISCPAPCTLTGTVTLSAPLSPNFNGAVDPDMFTYSLEGTPDTWIAAPHLEGTFWFSTNASGDIAAWAVQIFYCIVDCDISNAAASYSPFGGSFLGDGVGSYAGGGCTLEPNMTCALYNENPGTWTEVPEAPSIALFVLGLAGILGLAYIKRAQLECSENTSLTASMCGPVVFFSRAIEPESQESAKRGSRTRSAAGH